MATCRGKESVKKVTFLWVFTIFLFLVVLAGFADDGRQDAGTSIGDETVFHSSRSNEETTDADEDLGLFALPLEEAIELKMVSSATLTETTKRLAPAAVTTITREQIDRSGARSLDELLEIYVPGLQIMSKNTGDQIGFRGIISDRNNKYLLLVNGHVMNNLTSVGAISERFLSMLGDIERIEVVRGAGSATYGPGAVAGVVSIYTFDSTTFEGTDVQIRQGFVEEFSSIEVRHGEKFDNDRGLFLYYGITTVRLTFLKIVIT